MKRRIIIILIGLLFVSVLFIIGYSYMYTAKFGAFPQGARLQKIAASPNYKDGEFKNLEPIPSMTSEKRGALQGVIAFLLVPRERPIPEVPVPTVKTDLKALKSTEDVLIWLGHSSFYMQLDGQKILIDPVFSESASPVPFSNKAFAGTNIYSAEDMPNIDILLITHDHWDHLDYPTVIALKSKIAKILCPLGVGAHFEHWGFSEDSIAEMDWHDKLEFGDNLAIHALPARHYSGRSLTRNKNLWAAYALITAKHKIYLSGDSGYGSHFKDAGIAFDGFDLALLDSGQYNESWRYVHMMPEDTAQATLDLQAKVLLPSHMGKFAIARHTWDDPFHRIVQASQKHQIPLLTPKIGELHPLDAKQPNYTQWWKEMLIIENNS